MLVVEALTVVQFAHTTHYAIHCVCVFFAYTADKVMYTELSVV